MTAPITAIVVALDEATHILPCLATLRWAAEILVVVDARSSDGTAGLAAAAGARVLCRAWDGWAGQRNYALTQARQPWAFFVDADERVPLDLAEEIQARLNGAGSTPVNADTPTTPSAPGRFSTITGCFHSAASRWP